MGRCDGGHQPRLRAGFFLCYSRAMTDDKEIYRSANELIKQHGEGAPIHAAKRADELLEAGDLDGQAVWKRILAATEELLWKRLIVALDELLSKERPKGEKLN